MDNAFDPEQPCPTVIGERFEQERKCGGAYRRFTNEAERADIVIVTMGAFAFAGSDGYGGKSRCPRQARIRYDVSLAEQCVRPDLTLHGAEHGGSRIKGSQTCSQFR